MRFDCIIGPLVHYAVPIKLVTSNTRGTYHKQLTSIDTGNGLLAVEFSELEHSKTQEVWQVYLELEPRIPKRDWLREIALTSFWLRRRRPSGRQSLLRDREVEHP
jgi:hypothetical protein